MTEKLDMTTPDGVTQNIERIAALFPNCVTEVSEVETGHAPSSSKKIDFDLLRQELSRDIVEGPKERYRLEWPGKREAIVTANMPTINTLRPVREDSINFDTTENLYIEGDNLEVLKLLQESYLGKIKMIYIDPPYNTGNDFVYKDNFAQNTDEFKADSGMTDELGNRLVANPETAGRYHSDWLTMMYPRLKLARNLLTNDGVIFISIDDNEVHNLRKMCDEVFGEVNFVGNIIWQSRTSISNDYEISQNHNHTITYSKDRLKLTFGGERLNSKEYVNPDNDIRGPWKLVPIDANHVGGATFYPIKNPKTGVDYYPPNGRIWAYNIDGFNKLFLDGRIKFGMNDDSSPKKKLYLNERLEKGDKKTPSSILLDAGSTKNGTTEIMNLFDGKKLFDYPKPTTLLVRLLEYGFVQTNDIILDFFSGSATTAHAVMQLNAEDGGNRKFIMVQLPEKTDEKTEAYKAGYQNICEIGKERIRRAGKKLAPQPPEGGVESATLSLFATDEGGTEHETQNTKRETDVGFRVYRLDTSNMQDVYYRPQDYKQEMMDELFANHIKTDRTADDLVAQVMLDWGLPLSLPIEKTEIAGKTVYKVDGNALYCCFDDNIDEAFARAVAPFAPLRIVFHDHSFASDTAKENVRQLLKQLSNETEMKVV